MISEISLRITIVTTHSIVTSCSYIIFDFSLYKIN